MDSNANEVDLFLQQDPNVRLQVKKCMSNLRQLRQQRKLTQEQLAMRVDITQSYLSRLEQGGQDAARASLSLVTALANALGVELANLPGYDNQISDLAIVMRESSPGE